MVDDSTETQSLFERIQQGDRSAFDLALVRFRARLKRIVQFRIDRRLQGRIDASDVVQETCLEATKRLDEYLAKPDIPFFLWLRLLVGEQLTTLHRHHLGVQLRDATREVSLFDGPIPAASSAAIAAQLMGDITSPSVAAIRAERVLRLQEALNEMDPIDREVLCLRHFEHLSRAETARILDIQESAASKRYVRALKRLKDLLGSLGATEEKPQ
jgi:RNA polymerase sigma-70 factor (ECF subfamily)